MKILIIEDNKEVGEVMANILKKLGEVRLCTSNPKMPTMVDVLKFISESDVILLDNGLGTNYSGRDLYPYCKGKKVIDISSAGDFGNIFSSYRGNKLFLPIVDGEDTEFKKFVIEALEK